ncbi:MAG TPA: DUF3035 domain-containing protein [Caulobacteraceae bacterium]|jgi:hypothetical protein|nr:DUF3035 domain-containing protein [Caulobacteraceae bacterium]
MRKSVLILASTAVAAFALSACQHAANSLGLAKVTPDEFRVVTKAPLVIPPEYAMRPPAPGEPRPQELQPESAARLALLGQSQAADRSEGEKLLVQRAGADHADPLARYVVDDEFGAIAYKDKTFADKVLFWRKEAPMTSAAAGATIPAPLDVAAEEKRLKSLTGGKDIVIRRSETKRKLPGL